MKLKEVLKKLLLFSLFLNVVMPSMAQDQNRIIDSLTLILRTAKEDTVKVKLLNHLSQRLSDAAQFDPSMDYAKRALSLAEKLKFTRGVTIAYNNMGVVYFKQGNYPEALKNYLASLAAAKKDDKPGIAYAYNYIGTVYLAQGNYLEALKSYLASLSIAEEIGDKQSMINCYGNMGIIYVKQRNYTEALKSYSSSLELAKETGDKRSAAGDYVNIGHVYELQNNSAEALKSYFQALQAGREIDSKQIIAYSSGNIANIYKTQNNYTEALKYYSVTLKIGEETGDKSVMAICCLNVCELYIKTKQLSEARSYLDRALMLSKEIGSKDKIAESYLVLSVLDSVSGNYKQAYQYHRLYSAMRDSILNEESGRQISGLKIKYETEKKDKEILLLNKNDEIKTVKIEKQKAKLIYLIAGFSLLVIFTIITFWLYDQKRKLAFRREILETKMHALRSQMNPHFTFNVLNSIQYYAGENDMKQVQHYLRQFSKLIRLVLDQSRMSYITVEQEISMLKLYLELEEMRFEEEFKYSIESVLEGVDPEKIFIPGMLIQPIVENAIKHGIEHKEGEAFINIVFYLKDFTLICKITDNGIGREEAMRLKSDDNTHISQATSIIKERMEALSSIYNIRLESKMEDLFDSEGLAAGTCVTVEIPVQIRNEGLKDLVNSF